MIAILSPLVFLSLLSSLSTWYQSIRRRSISLWHNRIQSLFASVTPASANHSASTTPALGAQSPALNPPQKGKKTSFLHSICRSPELPPEPSLPHSIRRKKEEKNSLHATRKKKSLSLYAVHEKKKLLDFLQVHGNLSSNLSRHLSIFLLHRSVFKSYF